MPTVPFVQSTALTIKTILFLVNVTAFFVGALFIYLGFQFQIYPGIYNGYLQMSVLALGIIILLISFLGWYGASKENYWSLKTYFKMLLFLVIIQIALGTTAYYFKDDGEKLLTAGWNKAFRSNPQILEQIEQIFECCGFYDPNDRAIPLNCRTIYGFTAGCFNSLSQTYEDTHEAIGVLGVVLGSIELFCLLGTAVLFIWFDYRSYLIKESERVHQEEYTSLLFHQRPVHNNSFNSNNTLVNISSTNHQPPSYSSISTYQT